MGTVRRIHETGAADPFHKGDRIRKAREHTGMNRQEFAHAVGITDPKLTPHSLRHAFASELVEQGVDIRVVQELMLHEDLGTTQIYTRVSERRKSEGILTIAPMLFPTQAYRKAA